MRLARRSGRKTASSRRRRRGGVTIETAVTLPILAVIFFGVTEVGLIADRTAELTRTSREAARGASRGWTPALIEDCVDGLTSLDPNRISVTCEYQPLDHETGVYGSWTPLGSVGPCNNARDGDRVRVRMEYEHVLVSGRMFAGLVDGPEEGTKTLSAVTTLRRD